MFQVPLRESNIQLFPYITNFLPGECRSSDPTIAAANDVVRAYFMAAFPGGENHEVPFFAVAPAEFHPKIKGVVWELWTCQKDNPKQCGRINAFMSQGIARTIDEIIGNDLHSLHLLSKVPALERVRLTAEFNAKAYKKAAQADEEKAAVLTEHLAEVATSFQGTPERKELYEAQDRQNAAHNKRKKG